MGRPRKYLTPRRLKDGRLYVTVEYTGGSPYHKVLLKTRDMDRAQERIRALDGVTDTLEARKRIELIDLALDERAEKKLIEGFYWQGKNPVAHPAHPDNFDEQGHKILGHDDHDNPIVDTVGDGIKGLEQVGRLDLLKRYFDRLWQILEPHYEIRPPKTDKPCGIPLSDCLKEWKKWQHLEEHTTKHIKMYSKAFNEFKELVGDKAVNLLEKSDFTCWEEHLLEEKKGKKNKRERSRKWVNDHLTPIRAILKTCIEKQEWPFPNEVLMWATYKKCKHKSKSSNSEPLPPELFTRLLAKAEEMANINVETVAENLPVKEGRTETMQRRNNIKQARRIKRMGTMWAAILRLAANCGLDNVDVCRITWDHLQLFSDSPYMDFPRRKVEESVGSEIERTTPLVPSTVLALRKWKEYEEDNINTIFRNDAKKLFESSKISEGFKKLLVKIGGDKKWSFKHLRNIGPTLALHNHLGDEERERFLGHFIDKMSDRYSGKVPPYYLEDLVNLIGKYYLNGESVNNKHKDFRATLFCPIISSFQPMVYEVPLDGLPPAQVQAVSFDHDINS